MPGELHVPGIFLENDVSGDESGFAFREDDRTAVKLHPHAIAEVVRGRKSRNHPISPHIENGRILWLF